MESPIRILHLEDKPKDSELIQAHLESEGIPCELVRVKTQADFVAALGAGRFELVLSDYSLLGFDGMSALATLKQEFPEVPFILVTGTLGEEQAVESLKAGASDFVLKGNLIRLAPAIRQALQEAENRAQRKRAEEALRRNEQFLSQSQRISHIGSWEVNIATGKITWSDEMYRIYGVSPGSFEHTAEAFLKLIHPDDQAAMQAWISALLAGERPADLEFRIVLPDGDIRFIHGRGNLQCDAENRPIRAVGTAQDMTERKRAEVATRESALRLQLTVQSANVGLWDWDLRTNRVFYSPEWKRQIGYEDHEISNDFSEWQTRIHPDDLERAFQTVRAFIENPWSNYHNEFRLRHKDGSYRWIFTQASLLFDEQGKPIRMLGSHVDLTEPKQAEQALRQSEERYRAIMEQSADGIYLVDVESKCIIESNPTFAQMLGYSPEEIRGLCLYDFIAADKEVIDRMYEQVVRERESLFAERQYRRKDGSLMHVSTSAKAIFYGDSIASCHVVRDLTEKKAMEDQFLRAQRMESIGLLAGGIAHDLNNILAPILINAEILGPTLLQPTSQRMVSSIVSNAQRGADIVKQILTFARGMEEEFLVVSPKHLLKETERFLRETFPKSIQIQTEIPQDLWPLSGDATQLHQVLMNLCLNARDAMPKGGTLSLSARNMTFDPSYAAMHPDAKIGPYLLFSVEDTGAGIVPEHLQQVFDPFFTTKERDQGTGLGLATASAIVKGHGGFLQVSSQVGKGTQFSVYLPASPSAEMAKAEEEGAPLPTEKGEIILLVEDEASVREIIQVALEAYGYQVMAACDGTEAVSLYAQQKDKISLVVTDMAMPIMDGAATIRALSKIDPSVKVIAISGAEWEQKAAEASGLAFQAFLQKPFTAKRLLTTVAEVLKGGGQ